MYDSRKEAQNDGQTVFLSMDGQNNYIYQDIYDAMISKPGIGTYCMDSERIKGIRFLKPNREIFFAKIFLRIINDICFINNGHVIFILFEDEVRTNIL